MPADWTSFVNNVSQKFGSQDLKDSDDLAEYLTSQYIAATVNKAQSPFGNLHKKGKDSVMKSKFSEAFKMLEKERIPSFADKENDPMYADLEETIPEVDASDSANQVELDFRDWTEANKETIPPFRFSQFFSQFPNVPSSRDQVVTEIARKIIKEFDGSSNYLKWIYTLKYGVYSDYGREVIDKIDDILSPVLYRSPKIGDIIKTTVPVGGVTFNANAKIIAILPNKKYSVRFTYFNDVYTRTIEIPESRVNRKLNDEDLSNIRNLENQNISKQIYQEDHLMNPNRIPKYITPSFISKFTYASGSGDSSLFGGFGSLINIDFDDLYIRDLLSFFNNDALLSTFEINRNLFNEFISNISQSIRKKNVRYEFERTRYYDLKIRWINEIAEAAKKNEDPDKPEDPYRVMAKGVIDYWKSTATQPLQASPPVPPALLVPPQGGSYVPIYYGSSLLLANNLRRAFNSGKKYRGPGQKIIAAKVVAAALAFSFAMHLLELKFIYRGGIPGPNGPVPMIGFVPIVF